MAARLLIRLGQGRPSEIAVVAALPITRLMRYVAEVGEAMKKKS
ncbi:MAG TPA: hypothetical protein PLJ34_02710 [Hyphomicrobiales bacterium]|nr:hypothetical protein [Hyphomicrobiales bacterium]